MNLEQAAQRGFTPTNLFLVRFFYSHKTKKLFPYNFPHYKKSTLIVTFKICILNFSFNLIVLLTPDL